MALLRGPYLHPHLLLPQLAPRLEHRWTHPERLLPSLPQLLVYQFQVTMTMIRTDTTALVGHLHLFLARFPLLRRLCHLRDSRSLKALPMMTMISIPRHLLGSLLKRHLVLYPPLRQLNRRHQHASRRESHSMCKDRTQYPVDRWTSQGPQWTTPTSLVT